MSHATEAATPVAAAAARVTKSIRQRAHEANNPAPDDEPRSVGACDAYGCPCRGSVDLGGSGKFFCSWHAWAEPSEWQGITTQLVQHRWLIDHIGELQALYRKGGKGAPWIAAADVFWREQPDMQPTPVERTRWNLYLWRLREELAYRVSSRHQPAAPRPQQCTEERFAVRPRIAAEVAA